MIALILAFFVILYILSFNYCKKWFGKAYSKTGRWPNLKPGFEDFFLTVTPMINTICMIVMLFDSPLKEGRIKPEKNYDKFFGVDSEEDQK